MITSVYPVIMTDDPGSVASFFCTHFGFEAVFSSDWYVSLNADGHEIAFLRSGHETIPAGHRAAPGVTAPGLLVNIEVDDVDAVAERLIAGGVPVLQPLRSEDFGQRHIIVEAPGGIMVDVITPIPFTGEHPGG
ncbi:VOC family protein [Corynebacterium halotolerans]|uniref:Glyoxalase/bleomycin resistance protein n=1 Tax=Corynebacterium halotolerans YIM 70093 = DSM 44683 TaxID=1121362 RepID=M1NZ37_9CORY|nr:VOC family protein [Corynebacterium halotolerans]AGF72785.1 glyoxalase/bleomycin resistance protein [Corynebacterium halotolerans YIM 70093 = DSM 44683]